MGTLNRSNPLNFIFLVVSTILISPGSNTPADSIYTLQRITSPITLDGFPHEPVWQQIEPLPLTMYQPVFKGEMSEDTEIRVAYDNEYFYISGKLYDSEPNKIIANTMYRDRYSGDDTFAIILDTFNDNQNARWFFVTPTGVRVDQLISRDSEGEGSINRNWETYWDAATQITDEGWFVEIRIPFSSLGFQVVNDEVIMGLIAYRWMSRQSERHIFPDIAPNWTRGFTKPSQAQKIRLSEVQYDKPIYITPYVLGGFERLNNLMMNTQNYVKETRYTTEAGLDIKYPVSNNMNLDLTLNTDFAQVEADEAQVNLSRSPLFFPEKRQFFQERSGIFDFNLGGNNTLFYSRRIGLQQGRPIRIYGGVRIAGRTGKWDVGALNMQTESLAELQLPGENFGVYRARRDLINENSYLGGIVTSRLGMDGSYNVGTGVDFIYNYSGSHFIDLKYAATFDDQFTESADPLSNSIIRLFLQKQSSRGLFYRFTAKRSGERYLPAMGFESRFNYSLMDVRLSYGYYNETDSPIRTLTPTIRYFVTTRNEDSSVESMLIENDWSINFKNNSDFTVTANWWYENLQNPLFFSDEVYVAPGDYSFYGVKLEYGMSNAKLLRTDITGGINTFYDGSQISFGISPTWNQSKFFEVSGGIEFNLVEFPDRDQKEFLNIFRLRSLIALNTKVSLQLLSQYNYLVRRLGTNARFRYNFREGNDFWIVFSETSNTHLDRTIPTLPRFNNRVLLVKYTHTFH